MVTGEPITLLIAQLNDVMGRLEQACPGLTLHQRFEGALRLLEMVEMRRSTRYLEAMGGMARAVQEKYEGQKL